MRESNLHTMTCSVARSMGIFGDAWTLLIIRELFMGSRRFDDFQAYTGMAPKLLTTRLRKLESAGIVARVKYSEHARRFEYRLTEMGIDLYPVLVTITQWGDKWTKPSTEKTPPLQMIHKECGEPLGPAMTCTGCGKVLGPREVRIVQSEALQEERAHMRAKSTSSDTV